MTIATQSLLFKRENDELPTDTSSSRFGPTIMDAELAKQPFERIPKKNRSSGGVVVKLLAYGARGPGFNSSALISEIGYLLLRSRNIAERSLKQHKSSKQPTTTEKPDRIIYLL